MSNTVISVENLSKSYQLGVIGTGTFYGDLKRWWAKQRGKPDPYLKIGEVDHGNRDGEMIWALKDINLRVQQGEALGIIGRNGAGKSTLLKILSQVTAPTSGVVNVKGRIASLLEVGTGFHPELTGMENIYLNGAIMGMDRAEVTRKLDEIVDFSGVEKFIDTPVKRYSSGMYVRLAFAIAAHLEPDILVVDEVLAVGDAEFQKKCLGKMKDVAGEGRTVLFVSHQMNAIKNLCSTSILLSKGEILSCGRTNAVVARYLGLHENAEISEWKAKKEVQKRKSPYFETSRMCIVDQHLKPIPGVISANQKIGVLIEGMIEELHQALTVGFAVYASTGDLLFWSLHTDVAKEKWPKLKIGHNEVVGWIPAHFLNEGLYRVELILSLHYTEWISRPGVNAPAIKFEVQGELSESPFWMMVRPGYNAPILKFEVITG